MMQLTGWLALSHCNKIKWFTDVDPCGQDEWSAALHVALLKKGVDPVMHMCVVGCAHHCGLTRFNRFVSWWLGRLVCEDFAALC